MVNGIDRLLFSFQPNPNTLGNPGIAVSGSLTGEGNQTAVDPETILAGNCVGEAAKECFCPGYRDAPPFFFDQCHHLLVDRITQNREKGKKKNVSTKLEKLDNYYYPIKKLDREKINEITDYSIQSYKEFVDLVNFIYPIKSEKGLTFKKK